MTQEKTKPRRRSPLYFRALDWHRGEDEIRCSPIECHLEDMAVEGETQRRLLLAKLEKGTGNFYCIELDFFGESKENCGRQCDSYEPMNGKNGRCRHHRMLYEPASDELLLTLDEKLVTAPPASCRVCGCTEANCSQCVERTGRACHWVEDDLCSACRARETSSNLN